MFNCVYSLWRQPPVKVVCVEGFSLQLFALLYKEEIMEGEVEVGRGNRIKFWKFFTVDIPFPA
jgi:hypothetical protein